MPFNLTFKGHDYEEWDKIRSDDEKWYDVPFMPPLESDKKKYYMPIMLTTGEATEGKVLKI